VSFRLGFILGSAVAMHLGVGFVPIRKAGAIHPGPKAVRQAGPDWRGNQPTLTIQRAALRSNERVLLVDDWIETGSQALAARALIEDCGAQHAGLSVLVDQSSEEVRNTFSRLPTLCRPSNYHRSRSWRGRR